MSKMLTKPFMVALGVCSISALSAPALATHSWNNYHWYRSGSELTVPVGRNVSSAWSTYLTAAINGDEKHFGWNGHNADATLTISSTDYIESPLVPGTTIAKNCKPVSGTIQVCSSAYGYNGWLGIAQIWLSGGHITQGVTKLNDSYFKLAQYNTAPWRRLVTCQEIGHNYGLGHVDETFNNPNQGTCMDYTNVPEGGGSYGPSNEYPNDHDFEELALIYNHPDPTAFAVRTLASPTGAVIPSEGPGGDTPASWGKAVSYTKDGRPDVFEMTIAPGRKMVTHVFWAINQGPKGGH